MTAFGVLRPRPELAPADSDRVLVLDVVLLVVGTVLLFLLPNTFGADGQIRYDAMLELSAGRMPEGGYPLVTPLLAVPLHLVGRVMGYELGAAYLVNRLVFVAGLATVAWALRGRVGSSTMRPFLLLLVFGSMFPAHVTSFFGETVTAVLLGAGIALVTRERRARSDLVPHLVGWALCVVAVVNTPAAMGALVLSAAFVAIRKRTLWPVLPVVLAALLSAAELWVRTGALTSPYAGDAGYRTVLPYSGLPGFSYPPLLGILGILFSFGKGLLFFAPGLFLRVRTSLVQATWLAAVGGLVLVYCRWWSWYGGFFWGPRFFLFASVPASFLLALRLEEERDPAGGSRRDLVTLAALGLSCWVGASAAIGNQGQDICGQDQYRMEHLCWHVPEFSVLWRPLIERPDLVPAQVAFLALGVVVFLRLAAPLVRSSGPAWVRQLVGWRDDSYSQPHDHAFGKDA